jgi:hypothetical protein
MFGGHASTDVVAFPADVPPGFAYPLVWKE